MFKKLSMAVLGLAGLALAQTAVVEMNCVIDDTGEVWINGTRVIRPKKVGTPADDTTSFPVTVQQGQNGIAIMVHDGGWTGGMCASIDYSPVSPSLPDTLVSDGTWKCMDRARVAQTGAAVSSPTFDASSWYTSGDYGFLADDTGGHPKPFFERMGLEGANLFFHKAKWMWTPPTIYVRKEFTPNAATGSVYLRGRGHTFKMYLNGRLLGESSTVQRDVLVTYASQALNNGAANVVAFEAVCVDSVDFAFVRAGVQWGAGTARTLSDRTWSYSWNNPNGWNNTGFTQGSEWVPCGEKVAYSGVTDNLTPAQWVWATDLWFYKQFTLASVGTVKAAKATPVTNAVSTQYFTLSGKRIGEQAMSSLRKGAMVVKRTTLDNGQIVSKMVQVGK